MIPGDVLVKYSYTVNGVRHAGHTVIYNGDGKTLGASSSQNKCAATDTVQGLGVGSGNFTKGDVFRPLGVSLEYWPEKGKKIAVWQGVFTNNFKIEAFRQQLINFIGSADLPIGVIRLILKDISS